MSHGRASPPPQCTVDPLSPGGLDLGRQGWEQCGSALPTKCWRWPNAQTPRPGDKRRGNGRHGHPPPHPSTSTGRVGDPSLWLVRRKPGRGDRSPIQRRSKNRLEYPTFHDEKKRLRVKIEKKHRAEKPEILAFGGSDFTEGGLRVQDVKSGKAGGGHQPGADGVDDIEGAVAKLAERPNQPPSETAGRTPGMLLQLFTRQKKF